MTETVHENVVSVAEPSAPKSSLLEGMKSNVKAQEQKSESAAPAQSVENWFWAEGVQGNGEKPAWFNPAKYKTIADQAKSQPELEKMLGASGAPEEYDIGDLKEVIDLSNPHLQTLIANAKNKRVNNETFKEFAEAFVNYSKKDAVDFSKEIEKLGPDGQRRIETVKTWAENNLSNKALETMGKIAMSAEAIEFLDELRQFQFHATSQPPTGSDMPTGFVVLTTAEVEAEMASNYERYTNDKTYRAEIERKFKQAVG